MSDVTSPGPLLVTPSGNVAATALNVAVTVFATSIVTTHVGAVPLHPPPLHPANVFPGSVTSVSVTTVPTGYEEVHEPGQSIEPGDDATAPKPVPAGTTVSVTGGGGANVAVTLFAASTVTVHGPVPEQAPLHPVNVLPPLGAAVSVTAVPSA